MSADTTPTARSSQFARRATGQSERRVVKASESVMVAIVEDIVRAGLVEGDQLPVEAEMMEQYGVSRAPLREARDCWRSRA